VRKVEKIAVIVPATTPVFLENKESILEREDLRRFGVRHKEGGGGGSDLQVSFKTHKGARRGDRFSPMLNER
jgi:hypothetical protein